MSISSRNVRESPLESTRREPFRKLPSVLSRRSQLSKVKSALLKKRQQNLSEQRLKESFSEAKFKGYFPKKEHRKLSAARETPKKPQSQKGVWRSFALFKVPTDVNHFIYSVNNPKLVAECNQNISHLLSKLY